MEQLYILLGGNLGDTRKVFNDAIRLLSTHLNAPVAQSQVYSSPPWGFLAESDFLNQVLVFSTDLAAQTILQKCQKIERELGRIRKPNKGYTSRIIDIDLLFYGAQVIETETLQLPHPQLHKRRFTLLPLCDVAPNFIHPIFNKSNSELLAMCADTSDVFIA